MTIPKGTRFTRLVDGVREFKAYSKPLEMNGGSRHTSTIDDMLKLGWLKLVTIPYNPTTHKPDTDSYTDTDTESWQNTIALTAEELAENIINKRKSIAAEIRSTTKFYHNQLTDNFSLAKLISIEEDKRQRDAGNSGHFTRRAGNSMTGAQYILAVFDPQVKIAEHFRDDVTGIENDLLSGLTACADKALDTYDIKTPWDELEDFEVPTVEDIPNAIWAAFKVKLKMKIF